LAKGDLIVSRAKKGVTSERKGAIPQEESGSDSKVELMMAKFMANIEERSKIPTNGHTFRRETLMT